MTYYSVTYDLNCRNCKRDRDPGMYMINTDNDLSNISRNELIQQMSNFEDIECEYCNNNKWSVYNLELDGVELTETQNELSSLISQPLKIKLEKAFEDLKNDIINPLIIAEMDNLFDNSKLYLIAKNPDEDSYYCIVDKSNLPKKIAGMPYGNMTEIMKTAKEITPFRAKAFIDNNLIINDN